MSKSEPPNVQSDGTEAWLRAENSRLRAMLNSMGKAAGRIVFSEIWIDEDKLRCAVLASEDKEGEEAAAKRIAGLAFTLLRKKVTKEDGGAQDG